MTKWELEQCIKDYGKDIYSFCKYLTCNLQEAEDLYQDTFLKAVELQKKINNEMSAKSYLLSVAVRIWKNKKRKAAWRNRLVPTEKILDEEKRVSPTEQQNLPEEFVLEQEKLELVRKQVTLLPERLRVCVLLFYMEELSIAEIAHILKVPEGTVKSRLHQARTRLKKELETII